MESALPKTAHTVLEDEGAEDPGALESLTLDPPVASAPSADDAAAHHGSEGRAGVDSREQPTTASEPRATAAVEEPASEAPKPQQAQRPLQHTFEAIKLGSLRLATAIKERALKAPASADPADATPPTSVGAAEPPPEGAPAPAAAAGGSTFARIFGLGAMARETSRSLVQTATEGFKRLAVGDPLLALCRSEPVVPQLVLACCTALVVGGGVSTQGIFKEEPPAEEVERLSASVAGGRPALLPPGTSPHVIATLLKHFLLGLQEPVLTYRLLPDWITVAGDLSQVESVVARLPAASANVLRLVLEVCHYVAANAAETEMDALALAQVLAPCMAWLPPALKAQRAASLAAAAAPADGAAAAGEEGAAAASAAPVIAAAAAPADAAEAGGPGSDGGGQVVPLEGDEMEAVVLVLEALINKFPQIYG